MKVTATIKFVRDKARAWDSRNGPMVSVEGAFEDGSDFAINCKPENGEKRVEELKAIVGVEGEFEFEPKPDYQGRKQWKLVSWPGKPEKTPFGGGAGGGQRGGGYQVRYRDTPEGTRAEQDSIHRSVALTQAVAARDTAVDADGILKIADRFYAWLSQGQPQLPTAPTTESSGPPTQPSIGSYDPLKDQKEFFGESHPTLPAKSDTVKKYLSEIEAAVQKKDAARIEALAQMALKSFEQKRLTEQDFDCFLNQAITDARKAVKSAGEVDAW